MVRIRLSTLDDAVKAFLAQAQQGETGYHRLSAACTPPPQERLHGRMSVRREPQEVLAVTARGALSSPLATPTYVRDLSARLQRLLRTKVGATREHRQAPILEHPFIRRVSKNSWCNPSPDSLQRIHLREISFHASTGHGTRLSAAIPILNRRFPHSLEPDSQPERKKRYQKESRTHGTYSAISAPSPFSEIRLETQRARRSQRG
jgi:hypothetical protein